nr:hypothetical protein [Tanacetum cinerariifolium]
MARQWLNPKRKRDATWFRDKVLLAQRKGKVLNEEEPEFLADPGISEGPITKSVITYNAAYQADDLDVYDSECDEIFTAKAVLMANLSSYGSNVLSKVPYSENIHNDMLNQKILMLEEKSRSKMLLKQSNPIVLEKKVNIKLINYAELNRLSKDFGKYFVPQQELSDEQAFRLQTSHPNTDQSDSSPIKIEAPQELPKCLELEAELIKQHNMVEKDEYNRLSKRFSELEQHCISLEIAMQLNKEIFQKNNTSVNQIEPSFDQLFDLNNLKAEL